MNDSIAFIVHLPAKPEHRAELESKLLYVLTWIAVLLPEYGKRKTGSEHYLDGGTFMMNMTRKLNAVHAVRHHHIAE